MCYINQFAKLDERSIYRKISLDTGSTLGTTAKLMGLEGNVDTGRKGK